MAFGILRKFQQGVPIPKATPVFASKLPHIDPAYPKKYKPPGSDSEMYVQCDKCCALQRLCDRKNWNGTSSYCPVCNDAGYTWA